MRAPVFPYCRRDGREKPSCLEHKHVLIVEVFEEIFEFAVFDFARFAMQHEHAALVTVFGGIFCDEFFGEFELKLG